MAHSLKDDWIEREQRAPSVLHDGNSYRCRWCDMVIQYRHYGRVYGARDVRKEESLCAERPGPNRSAVRCYECDSLTLHLTRGGICWSCYLLRVLAVALPLVTLFYLLGVAVVLGVVK